MYARIDLKSLVVYNSFIRGPHRVLYILGVFIMGFIQFESVDHANRVADLLGMDRPYAARLGDAVDEDTPMTQVRTAMSMAKEVADIFGDTPTTSELLRTAYESDCE